MRQEKQLLLDEIHDQMEKYGSFVIMSYIGLGANDTNEFRNQIRSTGGNIEVVSKRLLMLAANKAGVSLDLNALTGHIGLVFGGSDPLETAKCVYDFRKEHEDNVQVLGGHIDGELYSAEEMDTISKLPSQDVLRAQFLGLLEAPMAQTVSVMEALVSSIVYCLDNKVQQQNQ